ncbi:uncharacterized protein LOC133286070 [Gastrolobium bilobum]|uniref:uncharacterized protein LOC133286070 n=1 Tax=Gastrolobium bilobum TaxID=150636 RepID=UPI002AB05A34|nr:uncharacterized protein LOC133286070 [Gastrolobium bilobum]
MFKKLQNNILFAEALVNIPNYAKFMKGLLSRKHKLQEFETVALTEECSAIIQKKFPPQLQDPGSFNIPIAIGNINVGLALPNGVIEDVLVKVDKFIFPVDFVVLDMEEEGYMPLLLSRPFLATAQAIIDVEKGKLKLRMDDEKVTSNVFDVMKHAKDNNDYFRVDILEELLLEKKTDGQTLDKEMKFFDENSPKESSEVPVKELEKKESDITVGAPKVELKELPSTLKYVFLGDAETYPVIINKELSNSEETKLMKVLKDHKTAIGWFISDLKEIDPSFCTHKILMEDNIKPVRQP